MAHYFEEQTDIKLIILFITENFKCPVTDRRIVEAALSPNILNYFDLEESMSELLKSDLLEAYGDGRRTLYQLTQKGKDTLTYFEERIPYSVREALLASIKKVRKEDATENDISAEYEKVDDLNYSVRLKVSECGFPLFELFLSVPDEKTASEMCLKFRKDPTHYYQKIFGMMNAENE